MSSLLKDYGRAVKSVWAAFSVITLCGPEAYASGQLPQRVIRDETFTDSKLCRSVLSRIHYSLVSEDDQKYVPVLGKRLIFTNGPIAESTERITYDVELGWEFRTELPEVQQIRTSYTYERRRYVCDGGHLTGTSTDGYSSDSYEELSTTNRPKESAR